jgi:ATP-binding cassette subfamily F protein uup
LAAAWRQKANSAKNNDMSSTAQNASGKKVKLSKKEQRDFDALERRERIEALQGRVA